MCRFAIHVAFLTLFSLLVPVAAAAAVKVGDVVRVNLKDGAVVQGKLVAETETSFLISVGDQNVAVPLSDVAEMAPVGAPAPIAEAPAPAAPAPPPGVDGRIPPRPRRGGLGLIIPGWIMLGVGGLVGLALLTESNSCDDSDYYSSCDSYNDLDETLGTGALLVAATGGIMAAVGHARYSRTTAEIEAWEQRYGDQAVSRVQLTPIVTRDTGGLGLAFSF